MAEEDYKLIESPLSQKITQDGITIEVHIYRGESDPGWILEVIDNTAASTVWNEQFATDEAALDELLQTIRTEGIQTFLESSDAKTLH